MMHTSKPLTSYIPLPHYQSYFIQRDPQNWFKRREVEPTLHVQHFGICSTYDSSSSTYAQYKVSLFYVKLLETLMNHEC